MYVFFIFYRGDITVATENLSSLFKAARVLQISGLSATDAIGVRSSDLLLSSSNAKSTSKDSVNTAVSTGTSQVCLRIRRNVNTNKLQTSGGAKKSTASSPIAMRNLAPAKRLEQRHKGASSFVPALETVDPLDTNNQKRPESVASSDGQIRYKCSTVAGVFMLLPDEETLSVDTDGEVTEEYNEVSYVVLFFELIPLYFSLLSHILNFWVVVRSVHMAEEASLCKITLNFQKIFFL